MYLPISGKMPKEVFYKMYNSNIMHSENFLKKKFDVVAIVSNTESGTPTKKQFHALMQAMKTIGEKEYFFSMIENHPNFQNKHNKEKITNWILSGEDYSDFDKTMGSDFVDSVMFSPYGTWGFLIAYDDFGLLTCNQSFWNTYAEVSEYDKKEVLEFIDQAHLLSSSIKWVPRFIDEVTIKPPNEILQEKYEELRKHGYK